MTTSGIHMGDIGTVFEITLMEGASVVDVSKATAKEIRFRKPKQANTTKPAEFVTDGKDGKIQYTTVAGDLDKAGEWKLQACITLPSGTWRSDIGSFEVHKNL